MGLIIVGVGTSWKTLRTTKVSLPAISVALLTALFISIYSTIDGAAARMVNPLTYVLWSVGLSALFAAPFIVLRYGARLAALELKENWTRILLVGFLMVATYGAVLFTYSIGSVTYAGSIREVSIVFGALLGWRFLGEGMGMSRVAGALLISIGIIVIATLG
jgi:drug/metabolite transporter (DMT)-like permease